MAKQLSQQILSLVRPLEIITKSARTVHVSHLQEQLSVILQAVGQAAKPHPNRNKPPFRVKLVPHSLRRYARFLKDHVMPDKPPAN
jgi:hypothetical protein